MKHGLQTFHAPVIHERSALQSDPRTLPELLWMRQIGFQGRADVEDDDVAGGDARVLQRVVLRLLKILAAIDPPWLEERLKVLGRCDGHREHLLRRVDDDRLALRAALEFPVDDAERELRSVDLLFHRHVAGEESVNRLVSDGIDVRVAVDSGHSFNSCILSISRSGHEGKARMWRETYSVFGRCPMSHPFPKPTNSSFSFTMLW